MEKTTQRNKSVYEELVFNILRDDFELILTFGLLDIPLPDIKRRLSTIEMALSLLLENSELKGFEDRLDKYRAYRSLFIESMPEHGNDTSKLHALAVLNDFRKKNIQTESS